MIFSDVVLINYWYLSNTLDIEAYECIILI